MKRKPLINMDEETRLTMKLILKDKGASATIKKLIRQQLKNQKAK